MGYRFIPEGGLMRRHKFLILFLASCVIIMGYYLYSLLEENKLLTMKSKGLTMKLGKYITSYQQCEKNLKTSRKDVMNVQQSNRAFQTKLDKADREITSLEEKNVATEMKLQSAFTFFTELKDLLGNSDTLEDNEFDELVFERIKSQITQHMTTSEHYNDLTVEHDKTSEALDSAKKDLTNISNKKRASDTRLVELDEQVETLTEQLEHKSNIIMQLNTKHVELVDSVKLLTKEVKKCKQETTGLKEKLVNAEAEVMKISEEFESEKVKQDTKWKEQVNLPEIKVPVQKDHNTQNKKVEENNISKAIVTTEETIKAVHVKASETLVKIEPSNVAAAEANIKTEEATEREPDNNEELEDDDPNQENFQGGDDF